MDHFNLLIILALPWWNVSIDHIQPKIATPCQVNDVDPKVSPQREVDWQDIPVHITGGQADIVVCVEFCDDVGLG